MKPTKTKKIAGTLLGVLASVLLFLSPGLRLPVLDDTTDGYFGEAITKAGVTYATCRVINASVSIAKDSSLNLEPAGIGVTLAVGQALDPIDDMVERVSDVLVTAITSLGVQKLAFEIGVSIAPRILAAVLLIFSALIWCENENMTAVRKTLFRVMLLILAARFALPISAQANGYIQDHYFAGKIADANRELALGGAELDKLMQFTLPEIDGVLGTIKNNTAFVLRKSIEFRNAIVSTVSNAGSIVDSLLELAFLYIGVFLIQVVALPIMVFFLLIKFTNSLFGTDLRVIMHYSAEPGDPDLPGRSESTNE